MKKKLILLFIILILSTGLIGCKTKDITKEDVKTLSNATIDKTADIWGIFKEATKEMIAIAKKPKEEFEIEIKEEEGKKEEVITKSTDVKTLTTIEIGGNISVEEKKPEVKKEEPIIEIKKEEGKKEEIITKPTDVKALTTDEYIASIIGVWYADSNKSIMYIDKYGKFSIGIAQSEWDAFAIINSSKIDKDKLILELNISFDGESVVQTIEFNKIDNSTLDITNFGETTRHKLIGKNMEESNKYFNKQ